MSWNSSAIKIGILILRSASTVQRCNDPNSSNTEPAFALFEKRAQRRQIIFSSLQRDRIDVVPPQRAGKFRIAATDKIHKETARFAIRCVDLDLFTGLGVL